MKRIGGNPDIARKSIEAGETNRDNVYNAVRVLTAQRLKRPRRGPIRLRDIWEYLDSMTTDENKYLVNKIREAYEKGDKSWTSHDIQQAFEKEKKKTITIRTIQNCIKRDPRIKKEGWHFYIDDESRFEKRYLNPDKMGREMYFEYTANCMNRNDIYHRNGETPFTEPDYATVYFKDHIIRLGLIMTYIFFEGARPFRDKSMSLGEREDLVHYWIQNCIPFHEMFYDTTNRFDPRSVREKTNDDMAPSEINESAFNYAHYYMKKVFPELYGILDKVFKSNFKHALVRKRGLPDHIVRGKTYYERDTTNDFP